MTDEEFVNVMTVFEKAFVGLYEMAMRTDRDDILLTIQGKADETRSDVDRGIEMAKEDDSITLLQYGQLIWLRHALNDLQDVCERKLERLRYD